MDSKKIVTALIICMLLGSVTIVSSLGLAAYKFDVLEDKVKEQKEEAKETYAKKSAIELIDLELTYLKTGQTEIKDLLKELKR